MLVLIADDEPLIRLGIRRALEALPDLAVVAECGSPDEAVEAIAAHAPQFAVLDVQMPGGTGLDVVRRLGPARMPAAIFVTAFDAYAVQAFELNAVDYVLKPFDPERLQQAVERARVRLTAETHQTLAGGSEASLVARDAVRPGKPAPTADRIVVRNGERFDLVPAEAIDWIEAADNYVQLHCGSARHLLAETLTASSAAWIRSGSSGCTDHGSSTAPESSPSTSWWAAPTNSSYATGRG